MQSTNYALSERLENVYRSMSLSPGHQTSLLNEMEMRYSIYLLFSKQTVDFLFVYIFYIRPIFLYFSSDSEKSLNASRRPFSQIDEDEDVEVENPEIRINEENSNEVSCCCFPVMSTTYIKN